MPKSETPVEEMWYAMSTRESRLCHARRFFKFLPSDPRCKLCNIPFHGIGGAFARLLLGRRPSNRNSNFCNSCDQFAERHPGGAEIELTMLFADVRGSTAMAERMSPSQFSHLMNRFYTAANDVLVKTDAIIDKLVGDEVIGLYIPGFAGGDHARKALIAANDLLRVTGHDKGDGPWIPVGIGVHTGTAYFGTVGSKDRFTDVTVLGDAANITARLASIAGQGEIFISANAYETSGLHLGNPEQRQLELKGKSEPVSVYVIQVKPK